MAWPRVGRAGFVDFTIWTEFPFETNSISVSGRSPNLSRMSCGIVTCPFDVMRMDLPFLLLLVRTLTPIRLANRTRADRTRSSRKYAIHPGMGKQMTICGVPENIAERLLRLSRERGQSVNIRRCSRFFIEPLGLMLGANGWRTTQHGRLVSWPRSRMLWPHSA
jgi:hypothetical protein